MASRNDVQVTYNDSPRVAEIAVPSAEIIMQDLVDTLRDAEYSWQGNSFKKLVNASGKEDLGGGVKVGITVAMQNLLLAFAGRTTPAQTGTVISNPGSPIAGRDAFTDSAATFVSNGVARGSLVINFTDHSIADVISVDSETQLTTKTLVNGIGNTYDAADVYQVFNIVQVSATGGNLVAVDELQATISSILPTAFTQVVLTSSASATLSEQADIQYSSFGGRVHLDPLNETGNNSAGVTFPTGTPRQPSSNLTDADSILDTRGLGGFLVHGALTVENGTFPHIFEGLGMAHSQFMCMATANLHDAEFRNCMLMGTLTGSAIFERVHFMTVAQVLGVARECMFQGTVTLGGTTDAAHGGIFQMLDCTSAVPGTSTPTIDFNGTGFGLSCRNYNGGLTLTNKTGADAVSIDLNSGQIIVDASVTNGTIVIRGIGKVTDNSTGTAVVVDETIDGAALTIMAKIMRNRMETNPTTGIMTIYDDDDVTPLLTGNIYEDVLAGVAYRGRGMERRNRLT